MTHNEPPWLRPTPSDAASLPHRCDVLVVGAGPAGLGVALMLARKGVDVVVCEAAPVLGQGAFGRGPGVAMGWLHDHRHRLAGALGRASADEVERFVVRGHALAAELLPPSTWERHGGLLLAGDAQEAGELALAAEHSSAPIEAMLASEGISERWGFRPSHGASERGGSALVQPGSALESLALRARAAGATLALGSPVDTLDEAGGSPVARIAGHSLAAELVVLCAGVGNAALDPAAGSFLVPLCHYAVTLAEPAGSPPASAPWSAWYGQLRGRPLAEGGWLVAGGRTQNEPGGQGFPPQILRAMVGFFARERGLDDVVALEITRRWTRWVAHTRDGLPLVGPVPGRVRRILCTGFNDHDADLALAAAELVSQGVLTGRAIAPACMASARLLDLG